MKPKFSHVMLAGMLLVPSVTLVLPSASALRRADDMKTYALERTFKKDASDRYNVTLKAKFNNPQLGGDIDLTMDMIVKETTKDVKDGVATINSEFEEAKANFGGIEQDLTASFPKSSYKADKTGKVWDVKSEGGAPELQGSRGGNDRMISVVRSSFYPSKAVKVGDTWDISVVDSDKKDKEGKETVIGKGKAKAVAVEKVGEFEALKIKTKVELNLDEKAKPAPVFEGEGFVDITSGKMLKMAGIVEGSLGPLGNTKADISFSLMTGERKDPKKEDKPADKDKKGETEKKKGN